MAKKMKIGVVDLIRGEFVLKCAKYLPDRMEIAAVCEINEETIEKVYARFKCYFRTYNTGN